MAPPGARPVKVSANGLELRSFAAVAVEVAFEAESLVAVEVAFEAESLVTIEVPFEAESLVAVEVPFEAESLVAMEDAESVARGAAPDETAVPDATMDSAAAGLMVEVVVEAAAVPVPDVRTI